MRITKSPNGYEKIILEVDRIELEDDYEYVCSYDSGKTFSTSKDGLIFSLQEIVGGNVVTILNAAPNQTCEISIKPHEKDGILYKGHGRPLSNLVNPKATQKRGDYVTLASLDARLARDGCRMWQVIDCRGFWEKS